MKKLISILSLVALVAMFAPAFAQDTDPTPPPMTDCSKIKDKKAKEACKAAEKNKPPKK